MTEAVRDTTTWFAEELAASGDLERALERAALRLTGQLDGLGYGPSVVGRMVDDVRGQLAEAVEQVRRSLEAE